MFLSVYVSVCVWVWECVCVCVGVCVDTYVSVHECINRLVHACVCMLVSLCFKKEPEPTSCAQIKAFTRIYLCVCGCVWVRVYLCCCMSVLRISVCHFCVSHRDPKTQNSFTRIEVAFVQISNMYLSIWREILTPRHPHHLKPARAETQRFRAFSRMQVREHRKEKDFSKKPVFITIERFCSLWLRIKFIPKLYLRLLWFFRRTAALSRQIRTFPQLFRFCSDFGNPGIRQIWLRIKCLCMYAYVHVCMCSCV